MDNTIVMQRRTDFYDVAGMVTKLQEVLSDVDNATVLVFDANNEPIQSFRLEEVRLSDGSTVFNLRLLV